MSNVLEYFRTISRILTNRKARNASSVASSRRGSHNTETKMFAAYNRVLCGESVTVSDINLRIVCDNNLVCSKRYNINYMRDIKIIQLTFCV
jgi:hypothetical protein